MNQHSRPINIFLLLALILMVFPSTAHAYFDPGTGTLIVQAIAAFFVGVLVFIINMWGRIKVIYKRFFGKEE